MASPGPPEHYRFGPFELQPDQRRLLKDGVTVTLRPRGFDLLVALVDRAGHLVSKDELLARAWPNAVVDEAALHVQVSGLRKVVGSDAITTVSGRGYQFTLPVTRGDGEANRATRSKHNLPYQLTSFVGREQEIAQLEELLTANRFVTLTGAGGAGKARLAIEVASRLVDVFADGVWRVELAPLSDPRLVPQAVAQALEVKEQRGRPVIETLGDYLASKKLLLVLDNAEHLLEGCVQFVDFVLRRSPHVALLVTSRERLGTAGELTYRVPSLTVPGPGDDLAPDALLAYESVRLFVDRARLLRPDFSVTSQNAAALASICYRLDGMPLAIELAASRLRSMSVEELSHRLDHRFALLTDGSSTALPRHRTLRSMLDWSFDLLSERDQAMLRRTAVFVGGWTLASAEQVCAGDGINTSDVIERLTSLVDKSVVVTDERAGATRYRMLESVRQYALDRLHESGDEAHWRARHLACFLALAEAFLADFGGSKQQSWLARLAQEHDNLRAALAWSIGSSAEDGLRLARALLAFWRIHGHLAEGREWFSRLLDAMPSEQVTLVRARALGGAALLAVPQGDYVSAKRLFQESLTLYRAIGDPAGVADALAGLAYLSIGQADYASAEAHARECLAFARATDDIGLLISSLSNLAIAIHCGGDWPAARELFEEGLAVARDLGSPWNTGLALNRLARAECTEGYRDLAREHFAEGMTILYGLRSPAGVAESLDGFAAMAAAESPLRAVRLWAAATALRQEIGNATSVHEQIVHEYPLKSARAQLSSDAFDKAWNEGRAMAMADAIRYALDDQDGRDP